MYRLADGSLSTDYKVGDEFEVVVVGDSFVNINGVVALLRDDTTSAPYFRLISGSAIYEYDEYCCSWSALKPRRKQFTKADLKDGMVVTYRNKQERTVLGDGLYDVKADSAKLNHPLSSFADGMTDMFIDGDSPIDIIKVSYMNEVLWERKEETAEQKEIKRLRGVIEDAQKALSALEHDK